MKLGRRNFDGFCQNFRFESPRIYRPSGPILTESVQRRQNPSKFSDLAMQVLGAISVFVEGGKTAAADRQVLGKMMVLYLDITSYNPIGKS